MQLINLIDDTIDTAQTVLESIRKAIGHLVWLFTFTIAFWAYLTISLLTDHVPTVTDCAFQPSPIAIVPSSIGKTQRKTIPRKTAKTKAKIER